LQNTDDRTKIAEYFSMGDTTVSDLIFDSATNLAEMIRGKQASPVDIVEAHIRRIEEVNPKLNAFVTTTFECAREEARSAEQRIARGERVGPLHGVPVSVKDTFETAGVRTVAGSRLLENNVPERDAPVVARLKHAGAIVLGKTNVPEFAMDYRSENPVFGRTSNPWDPGRVPGGSSGGEGAAIASGCSPAGIGSDLGGSIRVPAHFCGIVGLKPTPGRIPVTGHIPVCVGPFALGNSNGPLARRVEDLGLMLKVLAGFDPGDPQSVPIPARDFRGIDARKLRVMWHTHDGFSPVTAATRETVERAAKALADRGLEVEERRPAGIERGFELWFGFLGQAGVPGIVRLYEGREELMGPLMQALKAITQPVTIEQFLGAWLGRDALRASVVTEMMDYPIILAPVTAVPAFEHDHHGGFMIEGQEVDYLAAFSYTMTYNLLGLPAAVVPCGRSPEGLPIGVQIVGRPFEEETVLAVAALLEESLGGFQRPPI
jgi:Asp-tRNA(Asn)/Glu-tRNA(Gln) amidotransferase A subunit family amidase